MKVKTLISGFSIFLLCIMAGASGADGWLGRKGLKYPGGPESGPVQSDPAGEEERRKYADVEREKSEKALPPNVTFQREIEDFILEMTNEIRKKNNLPKLKNEEMLRVVARDHSLDMIVRNYGDHVNPDGLAPWDRVAIRHRTLIGPVSENLFHSVGYDLNDKRNLAKVAVDWWMQSPPHRANILNPKSNYLGVGVAMKGQNVHSTQKFAEVFAYNASPVPEKVRRGSRLDLGPVIPVSGAKHIPEMFDIVSAKGDTAVTGTFKLNDGKADAAPGTYFIKYWFPADGGGYMTVRGQRIIIE